MNIAQIEQLWIKNGGAPGWAPLMAVVAISESGGDPTRINNTPSTGDYSVGLWQINYFANLLGPRTKAYGSPSFLQANPDAQAKAAIDLFGSNGSGLYNWKGDKAYKAWAAAGFPQQPSVATVTSWGLGSGDATVGVGGSDQSMTGQTTGCSSSGGLHITGTSINIGTGCQLKALTGGLLVGIGAAGLLVGLILLARQTTVGKQATRKVAKFVPGARAGGGGGGATAPAGEVGAPVVEGYSDEELEEAYSSGVADREFSERLAREDKTPKGTSIPTGASRRTKPYHVRAPEERTPALADF